MLKPLDIVTYLHDREFEEVELLRILEQLVREQREDAACIAADRVIVSLREFRNKRKKRIMSELYDRMIPQINEESSFIRNEIAQKKYRDNKKNKKKNADIGD